MEFQQSSVQDRRPQQPGLSINLASNNPFRRTVSPAPNSPSPNFSPSRQEPDEGRRKSTNPFLDSYKSEAPAAVAAMPTRRPASPQKPINGITFERLGKKAETGITETLVDLSLQDQPVSDRNLPRRPVRRPPPDMMHHRPTHSNEDKRDMRAAQQQALDIFAGPGKSENRPPRRMRRNSDSSMIDVKDEERRRRERERRRREASGKDGKSRSGRPRKPQGMDIIDQLDVTGIYGAGMIHHDGPFDACNPHRNKKSHRAAPMSAFPVGSLNNVLGGSGPVNRSIDYDTFHGRADEGFRDFNKTKQPDTVKEDPYSHMKKSSKEQAEYNAKEKIEPVHGEESLGLGTSTFFEGTAASKRDIERDMTRQSEEQPLNPGGGLSRKRSIAQKIRGISRPRGGGYGNGVTSPQGRFVQSPSSPDYVGVQSAGGRGRLYEKNPFFEEEGKATKTGEAITVVPTNATSSSAGAGAARPRTASSPNRNRDRAPSSPRRDLYRVKTQDDEYGMPPKQENAQPMGFIGRVKSLRTKKGRPERFQNQGTTA